MDDGDGSAIDDNALDAELALLLSDPALWAVPTEDLVDRIVAAIDGERQVVVPLRGRQRVWRGRLAAGAIGAAAAAIAVMAIRPSTTTEHDSTIAMAGTELAPDASGNADLTAVDSGIRIDFTVTGLPRRYGAEFYEGWLKNCDGTALVPIGTFHELDDATGWAGVSLDDFAVITVTREVVAAPTDLAQGTSGEVVVSGKLRDCPPP